MIENTSTRDPLLHLAGSLGGTTRYIEELESAGQRQLVNSTDLPTKLNHANADEFEALGFTFGDPHPHDPLFRPATLPTGWKREGSEHAMWSYIVDDLGRRRVSVFYKAAFYDRKAFMNIATVGGYVSDAVYDTSAVLVLDDSWATAEAVNEAIDAIVARNDETIASRAVRDDDYSRERVAELRQQNERAEALRAQVA